MCLVKAVYILHFVYFIFFCAEGLETSGNEGRREGGREGGREKKNLSINT